MKNSILLGKPRSDHFLLECTQKPGWGQCSLLGTSWSFQGKALNSPRDTLIPRALNPIKLQDQLNEIS